MHSGIPHRSTNTLHLWCAHAGDLLNEETSRACASLLSEDERARWQRFRVERARREYLAAHALLRNALSHYGTLAPRDWRFKVNAHGKPAPDPDCGLQFNLSHSGGLAVCLISEAAVQVGVDVEPAVRANQIAAVARKVFSPYELAQLDALPVPDRLNRYLDLWTLKEAYVKARGLGFSLPLDRISFLSDDRDEAPRLKRLIVDAELDPDPDRWSFTTLDHAGNRIALVVENAAAGLLDVREARPPAAPAIPVATPAPAWLPER
jgi:4'-phosphopantetheinyl transferase